MLYKITGLTRARGANTILDIDHLEIEREKVYTLVGPNGAGKTTLLHILAFLDAPTSGEVYFLGDKVSFTERRLGDLRRTVTLVEQYPILFTGSVRTNIEYGLKLRRLSKYRRREKVEEVLEMVGMSSFIDADARKLSGGENKRIALARALALEPEVLLCDEPTANVDSENQEIILRILERCNREKSVSLIFATHYLSQASRLADHTLVLQNGKLSGAGRENRFIARFRQTREGVRVFAIGHGIEIETEKTWRLEKSEYTVQFPPEKILLFSPEEKTPKVNHCHGRIEGMERRGERIRFTVDCGALIQVEQTVAAYRDTPRHIGETVALQLPVDQRTFL